MHLMWICIRLCQRFEQTFNNTQQRKVEQVQRMWLCIFFCDQMMGKMLGKRNRNANGGKLLKSKHIENKPARLRWGSHWRRHFDIFPPCWFRQYWLLRSTGALKLTFDERKNFEFLVWRVLFWILQPALAIFCN